MGECGGVNIVTMHDRFQRVSLRSITFYTEYMTLNTILKCKIMNYMVGSTIWSLLRMHLLGQRLYTKPTPSVALQMQYNPPMLMHTRTTRESHRVPCSTINLPIILHPHKLPQT